SIECRIMDWADDTAYSLNDIADGIQAGFIHIDNIEKWAAARTLNSQESALVGELLNAIRRGRVESTTGKKIGAFLKSAELEETSGFLSDLTARHRYRLVIDPAIDEACALYKRLSLDLVFKSQQLQQLDRKSDYILSRLFEVFADLYIHPSEPGRDHYQLLS